MNAISPNHSRRPYLTGSTNLSSGEVVEPDQGLIDAEQDVLRLFAEADAATGKKSDRLAVSARRASNSLRCSSRTAAISLFSLSMGHPDWASCDLRSS